MAFSYIKRLVNHLKILIKTQKDNENNILCINFVV